MRACRLGKHSTGEWLWLGCRLRWQIQGLACVIVWQGPPAGVSRSGSPGAIADSWLLLGRQQDVCVCAEVVIYGVALARVDVPYALPHYGKAHQEAPSCYSQHQQAAIVEQPEATQPVLQYRQRGRVSLASAGLAGPTRDMAPLPRQRSALGWQVQQAFAASSLAGAAHQSRGQLSRHWRQQSSTEACQARTAARYGECGAKMAGATE